MNALKNNERLPKNLGWGMPTTDRSIWITIPENEFFCLYPGYRERVVLGFDKEEKEYYAVDACIAKKHHKILRKKNYGNATLYGGVTEKGFSFYLPIYQLRPGHSNCYYEKIMKIVKNAGESWVKIGDRQVPSVQEIKLFDTLPRPHPEYDPDSMFDLAFPDDFYIANSNHSKLNAKPEVYHWMNDIEEEV